jgi:hypothetical protein
MRWKIEHVSVPGKQAWWEGTQQYPRRVDLHRHHHRDDTGDTDHRDHEKIVELACLPSRFEADVAIAALEARGIKAVADHGDASGWDPMLSMLQGHRVLVFEGDLDTARTILAEAAGKPAP